MANYRESWDLSTIPEPELKREWARRNGTKGGYAGATPTTDPKVLAERKRQREYRRWRRAQGLK